MVTHIIEVLAGFHNVRCSFIFIQLHPPLPKKLSESRKQNRKPINFLSGQLLVWIIIINIIYVKLDIAQHLVLRNISDEF